MSRQKNTGHTVHNIGANNYHVYHRNKNIVQVRSKNFRPLWALIWGTRLFSWYQIKGRLISFEFSISYLKKTRQSSAILTFIYWLYSSIESDDWYWILLIYQTIWLIDYGLIEQCYCWCDWFIFFDWTIDC